MEAACFHGAATTARRRMIPDHPAKEEAGAMAAEAAIDAGMLGNNGRASVILLNDTCLDSFQCSSPHQFGIA
jgi:hypothetical protein